jgi:hypothetical protein
VTRRQRDLVRAAWLADAQRAIAASAELDAIGGSYAGEGKR